MHVSLDTLSLVCRDIVQRGQEAGRSSQVCGVTWGLEEQNRLNEQNTRQSFQRVFCPVHQDRPTAVRTLGLNVDGPWGQVAWHGQFSVTVGR
jgi:hypothetical protein